MPTSLRLSAALWSLVAAACACPRAAAPAAEPQPEPLAAAPNLRDEREHHLADLVQLTAGGENAEAYWSPDGAQLIFQTTRPPYACDQIMRMPTTGPGEPTLVSTGKGRTTCSYFYPDGEHVLFSSTHLGGDACPQAADRSQGYVWALYDSYEVFRARPDGSELERLTDSPGYDAESTICGKDGSIVFTSTRDGDIDLYRMDKDGKNVVRLTNTPGYDGGAFFSADCDKIVWRASRPTGAELDDYRRLLAQHLVRPTQLELWVANADGTEAHQVTYLGTASFAPYFFPSGKRIIFSSNYPDPHGREFDLWAVDVDGTHLERITYAPGFDGFPIFSPDGSRLAFSSNRHQNQPGETDVYVAKWLDEPSETEVGPAERFLADVSWLADDERGGRGIGTPGLDASAHWLADRFREIGLSPAWPGDDFAQPFDVVTGIDVGAATAVALDGKPVARDQMVPAAFSASGQVTGRVVSAGWGVTAPDAKVDDYKGVRAKGAVVVVRRFVPEAGALDDKAQRRLGDLRYKAFNAREHGAVALIVVDAPPPVTGKELPADAPLPRLDPEQGSDAGIPVVVLTRAAGAGLFAGRHKVTIAVALTPAKQPAYNIVGLLRADRADRLPGALVVGAHYDHLGMGGRDSLAPDAHEPHNGADDNASGVAALLEVARTLVARRAELRRDVYFVAFSAEESGVLGSTAFTRTPPPGLAVNELVAMLNMDMVGRLRDNRVSVLGGESAAEWAELVTPACARARVDCALGGEGYGPSDQTPFYAAGVPVLHFFTGAHADYHKPTDDTDKINAIGGARVAQIVADVAAAASAREARLTFKAAPPQTPMGDVRASGASLGTVPDYAGDPHGLPGLLLAGVRPGGPAETAGLRRGDRILKVGASEVRDASDLMFVLRKAKPGEHVKILFVRDGKEMQVEAVFGAPGRR